MLLLACTCSMYKYLVWGPIGNNMRVFFLFRSFKERMCFFIRCNKICNYLRNKIKNYYIKLFWSASGFRNKATITKLECYMASKKVTIYSWTFTVIIVGEGWQWLVADRCRVFQFQNKQNILTFTIFCVLKFYICYLLFVWKLSSIKIKNLYSIADHFFHVAFSTSKTI